jgi:hypothetical protein
MSFIQMNIQLKIFLLIMCNIRCLMLNARLHINTKWKFIYCYYPNIHRGISNYEVAETK